MSDLLPVGIHFGISREQYVADPGVNQSALKRFDSAKTPYHYKFDHDHPSEEDKSYLRIGTAFDLLIWSPDEYKAKVEVAPPTYPCKPTAADPRTEKPWTMKSGWCQEWWEERLSEGKVPLTVNDRAQVIGMVSGLEEHQDVPAILENSERHAVIIANHPTLGYRMKAELDLWPKSHSAALGRWYFELKTDGEGADNPTFHKKCFSVGYIKQVAYYLTIARYAGFYDMESCGVIVVESFAPYRCKIHRADWDDPDVRTERAWIDNVLPRYMACKESDNWPGYGTDWSTIEYPGWARRRNE